MLLVVVFTFFAVKMVAPNLFIADSPEINPLFIAQVLDTPNQIAAMPGNFMASLSNFRLNIFNNQENIQVDPNTIAQAVNKKPPADAVFKFVSKGVEAAEDPTTGDKYIRVAAGTKYKIVGYITINGKQYPKIQFIE